MKFDAIFMSCNPKTIEEWKNILLDQVLQFYARHTLSSNKKIERAEAILWLERVV